MSSFRPTAAGRRSRWGIGDALFAYPVALVLATVFGSVWMALTGSAADSYGSLGAAQVGLWLGFLGCPWVASRWKGSGRLADDFGLESRAADAFVGLPVGIAVQLVLLPAIYLLLRVFTGPLDVDGPARELLDRGDGVGLVVLLVGVVVIAPIAEELFFRGLLLRSLIARFGSRLGVGVSAVLFGATHFQLIQFVGLTAVGLVLGWLAERWGRLGPAIWAHVAFNATAAVGLLVSR